MLKTKAQVPPKRSYVSKTTRRHIPDDGNAIVTTAITSNIAASVAVEWERPKCRCPIGYMPCPYGYVQMSSKINFRVLKSSYSNATSFLCLHRSGSLVACGCEQHVFGAIYCGSRCVGDLRPRPVPG
jgi:hypothetical protein